MMSSDASPVVAIFRDLQAADPKWRVDIADPGGEAGWIQRNGLRAGDGRTVQPASARDGGSPRNPGSENSRRLVCAEVWLGGVGRDRSISPTRMRTRCRPRQHLAQVQGKHPVRKVRPASSDRDDARRRSSGGTSANRYGCRSCCTAARPQTSPVRANEAGGARAARVVGILGQGCLGDDHLVVGLPVRDRLRSSRRTGAGDPSPRRTLFRRRRCGEDATAVAPRDPRHRHACVSTPCELLSRTILLPKGSLCASCPLVSQEERVRRNTEWMQQLQNRK